MINSTTLSMSDVDLIRSCVQHAAAESFDFNVDLLIRHFERDERFIEADEAVTAWLSWTLFCFSPDSR